MPQVSRSVECLALALTKNNFPYIAVLPRSVTRILFTERVHQLDHNKLLPQIWTFRSFSETWPPFLLRGQVVYTFH